MQAEAAADSAAEKPNSLSILFVIKSLSLPGGGAEKVLAQISSALVKRGHRVIVVSFDSSDARPFYGFDHRVERIALGIGDIQARTRIKEIAQRLFALRRFCRQAQPDVAIGFMHSAYVPLALALWNTGVPAIASEHIVYAHYHDRPLERALLRIVAPLLSAATAISQPMYNGFPRSIRRKMAIAPNPVRSTETRADVAKNGAKVLLSVGRLEPQKDHATLIEAFAQLAEFHPDWMLRIIGEGELRARLEAQAERFRLEDRVELAGAVADIDREYSRAQLFVMPSLYESFGLATAEALAHGLPVVGFADCPGTNELIEDGVNGLLVQGPDRAEALAAGLARLMWSPDKRARMSAAAPLSVERFGLEHIAAQWEGLLVSVTRGST